MCYKLSKIKFFKNIISISLIFLSIGLQANVVDSLLQVVECSQMDTSIANAYNELAWEIHRRDLDKTLEYATKALEISEEFSFLKGESRAKNLIALVLSNKKETKKSLILNLESYEIAKQLNDKFLISNASNDLGIIYHEIGEIDKSMEYYQESLDMARSMNDTLGICFTLCNLSGLYFELENYDSCDKNILEAYELGKASSDPIVRMITFSNFGYYYMDRKKYKEALDIFRQVEALAVETDDKIELSYVYSTIGYIQNKLGFKELSISNVKKGLEYSYQVGDYIVIANLLTLAEIYLQQGVYNEAIHYGEQCLKLADQDILYQKDANFLLAKANKEVENFDAAYDYFTAYDILRDSIFSKNKLELIAELDAKYGLEQRDKENQLLKLEQEKNLVKIAYQSNLNRDYFIFVLLLLLLASLLLYAYRQKMITGKRLENKVVERTLDLQKANTKLKHSIEELEQIAYVSSHDLKQPLRTILNFVKLLQQKKSTQLDDEGKLFLNFISDSTARMDQMVNDVLNFSIIGQSAQKEWIDVNRLMHDVIKDLNLQVEEKDAAIVVNQLPKVYGFRPELNSLFQNLISNALKYSKVEETPSIKINCEEAHKMWLFSINDNGIGFDIKLKNKIFGMFQRLENAKNMAGTGIGLAHCKKIVELHGGKIWVESKPDFGSTFFFSLPK